MRDLGESLPIFRPPLDLAALAGEPELGQVTTDANGSAQVAVRYLTPHNKWAIHSQYFDNHYMLSMFRGGPTAWMSPQDAEKIGVKDGEWIECVNNQRCLRGPCGCFAPYARGRLLRLPRSGAYG